MIYVRARPQGIQSDDRILAASTRHSIIASKGGQDAGETSTTHYIQKVGAFPCFRCPVEASPLRSDLSIESISTVAYFIGLYVVQICRYMWAIVVSSD